MNTLGLEFLKQLQAIRTRAGEDFFFGVTLGGEGFWLLAVLGILFWVLGPRLAYRAGFALAVGDLLAGVIKSVVCLPRPWVRDPSIVPMKAAQFGAWGFSFPSGHVANTTLLWGGVAAAVRKGWMWIGVVIWIGLVAFSRMYLGVHTPLDVAGSLVLAIPVVWGMGRLYDWTEQKSSHAWWVVSGVVLMAVATWGFVSLKPMPEGTEAGFAKDAFRAVAALAGFFGAWFVERKWIRFDPARLGGYRIVAVVVGLLVLSLLLSNLRRLLAPFLGGDGAAYVAAAANPVWIFVVWPLLLKGLEKPISC